MKIILVVDYNQEIRDTLSDLFELEGYWVITARDVLECMDLLQRIPAPSAIILSQNQSEVLRTELTSLGFGNEKLARVPLIFRSAENQFLMSSVQAGLAPKAFEIPALLDAISAHSF